MDFDPSFFASTFAQAYVQGIQSSTPKNEQCLTCSSFILMCVIETDESYKMLLSHLREKHPEKIEKIQQEFYILKALEHEANERKALEINSKMESKSHKLDEVE